MVLEHRRVIPSEEMAMVRCPGIPVFYPDVPDAAAAIRKVANYYGARP